MLGKLIKYEFRSTAIFFLPIYAALIIISALTSALYRLSESFNSDFFNFSLAASVSIYVLFAMGLAVTTFVIIIIRFYKNLLGNEGYLMFTLPVSAEQNILAKLIPAVVWFFGSCVLGFFTIIPVLNFKYADFSISFEYCFAGLQLPFSLFLYVYRSDLQFPQVSCLCGYNDRAAKRNADSFGNTHSFFELRYRLSVYKVDIRIFPCLRRI